MSTHTVANRVRALKVFFVWLIHVNIGVTSNNRPGSFCLISATAIR